MKTKYSQMLDAYSAGKAHVSYSPLHLYIEPTNHCNLACSHCPHRIMTRKKGFMSLKLFQSVIDQCQKMGIKWVYLFYLGESRLHQNLDTMINYAHQKDIKVRLHSNGTLDISTLPRIDNLHISANETPLERIKPNINLLIKKKIPFTLDTIESVKTRVRQLYKKYLYRKRYCNWHGAINQEKAKNTLCSHPFKSFAVSWNGWCVPCCVDYNGTYLIGDATKQTLEEIWNSQTMQKIRKNLAPMCKGCDINRLPEPERQRSPQ